MKITEVIKRLCTNPLSIPPTKGMAIGFNPPIKIHTGEPKTSSQGNEKVIDPAACDHDRRESQHSRVKHL
jgi:hypothetical protein